MPKMTDEEERIIRMAVVLFADITLETVKQLVDGGDIGPNEANDRIKFAGPAFEAELRARLDKGETGEQETMQ